VNYPLKELGEFITDQTASGAFIGLMVRCPNCRMQFSAWFRNPIGDPVYQRRAEPVWDRKGETLETLTLSPSFMFVGHCHSWIKDGQVQVDSAFTCPPIDPEHVV